MSLDRKANMKRVTVAVGFLSRLRGLTGRRGLRMQPEELFLIFACGSIHTFGMRVRIDAAFLDGDGRVLKSLEGLRPCHFASCLRAVSVLERVSPEDVGGQRRVTGPFSPWLKEGDTVTFCAIY